MNPIPTIRIGNTPNPVLGVLPGTTIQTPGGVVQQHRFAITTITSLTIRRDQHHIAHPSTVTVCEADGTILWVDMAIDPLSGDVTISATNPVTGYVLIS